MAPKFTFIPDAWDDEYEKQADEAAKKPEASPSLDGSQLSRAERLAKHVEANRKIWESAENPEAFHFLEVNNPVPLATTSKPRVKLLSRRPVVAKRDPVTGLETLTLEDERNEEEVAKNRISPEERQAQMQREREEKQRRYDEARAKIFGEETPAKGAPNSQRTGESRQGRGRGRGRGGQNRNNREASYAWEIDTPRPTVSNSSRELYDPNNTSKASRPVQKQYGSMPQSSETPTAREGFVQAIRAPRGPDQNGRGFGSPRRGARMSGFSD